MLFDGSSIELLNTYINRKIKYDQGLDFNRNILFSNAKVEGRMYVEPNGGLGWVVLPWDLSTPKDKHREAVLSKSR